jgi:hypothetical protein
MKIIVFALLIFVGCKSYESLDSKITKEINSLNSIDKKKNFLEKLLIDDQSLRKDQTFEIMTKYGNNSKEALDFAHKQMTSDSINLIKTEAYLLKYGYPRKIDFGKQIVFAPWAVIHHSSDFAARQRNFETLYAAYLIDDIDEGSFSFYLNRSYEDKYQKRLERKVGRTTMEEIYLLRKELDLEDKRLKVLENIAKNKK